MYDLRINKDFHILSSTGINPANPAVENELTTY